MSTGNPQTRPVSDPAAVWWRRPKGPPVKGTLGVTVVIPARNEEHTLGMIIQNTQPVCDEIVVVDGNSTDSTVDVAKSHGVRVVTDNGKGKGDAIRVGATAASKEIVVFIDADGSHDPADIPRLVEPIQLGKADLLIGSRGQGGSDELHGDLEKLLRLVGSDIILIGINWRWKANLTDSQNGFRAIRREVILDLGLKENITTIEQEMTMKCLKKGYVVSEVPAHEYARIRGESTIRLKKVWFRYIYSWLKELLA
jgi:dolichol-phosphate mannosyltransferase